MDSNINNAKFSRREFFNYLLAILSLPAIFWWLYVGKKSEKLRKIDKPIMIGKEVPAGISFIGSAIVINQGKNIQAYEAKCTHLGCRITRLDGNNLVCQCHGSRFDSGGKAIQGPAREPLKELMVIKDDSGNYTIRSK